MTSARAGHAQHLEHVLDVEEATRRLAPDVQIALQPDQHDVDQDHGRDAGVIRSAGQCLPEIEIVRLLTSAQITNGNTILFTITPRQMDFLLQ